MRRSSRLLALMFAVALPVFAHADSVSTLPEYNGTRFVDPGPYQPPTVIGTFNITPGDTAITISGTFGNSLTGSSSGLDLYLGSILVAQCVELTACYNNMSSTPTPWSASLSSAQIALLGTGLVNFSVVQTSQFYIRLGETTLTQVNTAATPEPSTLFLLGTGALGLAGVFRRRFAA